MHFGRDAAVPNSNEMSPTEKHRSSNQVMRLPPVPHRADQLMEKVVTRQINERQWVSSTAPMDTFSPVKKLNSSAGNFTDSALVDPHLQTYWQRKAEIAHERSLERKRKKKQEQQTRKRLEELERQMYGGEFGSEFVGAVEEMGDTPTVHKARTSNTDQDVVPSMTETAMSQQDRCPIPLNERPVSIDEAFCLKCLLCPVGDMTSTMKLDHIDLRWLQHLLQGKADLKEAMSSLADSEALSSSSEAVSPSRSSRSNRSTVAPVPQQWLTLRSFDAEALSSDSFHYTKEIPYHGSILNSPRSAIVCLRNGVAAYSLLHRPEEYFALASESVNRPTLQLRYDLAENERLMLLESLRSQYDQLCGLTTIDEMLQQLLQSVQPQHEKAKEIAEKRFERDHRKLMLQEQRERRYGDLLIELEEEATQKALAMEAKITRQRAEMERRLQEKGDQLRLKAYEKRKNISRLKKQQQKDMEKMSEEMAKRREEKAKVIQEMKDERLAVMQQKAQQTAQRIDESRQSLKQMEEEEFQEMMQYAKLKREKAEAFLQRKKEEHEELLRKAGNDKARQEQVKQKAAETMARLRDHINAKLQEASIRFEEFQAERREHMKAQKALHHVRSIHSKKAIERAHQEEELMKEEILLRSQQAEERLTLRRKHMAKQQLRNSELHSFDVQQRQRIVATKLQQNEFFQLIQLSRMQMEAEEMSRNKSLEDEVVRLTRESDKKMRLHRKESKAKLEDRRIQQGKQSFRKKISLIRSFEEQSQQEKVEQTLERRRSMSAMARQVESDDSDDEGRPKKRAASTTIQRSKSVVVYDVADIPRDFPSQGIGLGAAVVGDDKKPPEEPLRSVPQPSDSGPQSLTAAETSNSEATSNDEVDFTDESASSPPRSQGRSSRGGSSRGGSSRGHGAPTEEDNNNNLAAPPSQGGSTGGQESISDNVYSDSFASAGED